MIDRTKWCPADERSPQNAVEQALERAVLPRLANWTSRELARMILTITTNPEIYRHDSRGTRLYVELARREIRARQMLRP